MTAGPDDVVERFEVDSLAHPDIAPQADPRDLQADLAVEGVAVGFEVLLQAADVLPVAVAEHPVERLALLEQSGEQLMAEIIWFARRDIVEHLRLEHVDAGVDRV